MPLDPSQLKRALLKPVVLIAIALPLLAAATFVNRLAEGITGPLAVAVSADGTRIVVAGAGHLYHLDPQGALQGVDEEILSPTATEVGLAWIDDFLFVSPDVDGDLLRCTDAACEVFSGDTYAPNKAVQVFNGGDRLWFSEAGNDRIQRYFSDGRRIDMPISDLSRPGSLWLQDDQLYVADSGAQKIKRYAMHKRGVDEPATFATYSNGDEDAPIDSPTRFIRSGDGFRAIFSDAARRHGVLAAIDGTGKVTPINVPDLVNPVALDALGDALLVVDEDRMQVLKVFADGRATPFGDAAFRAQLAADQSQRAALRMTWPILVILAALSVACGGTWLALILARQRGNPPLPVKKEADGITWLPRETDLAPTRIPLHLAVAAPAALVPAVTAGWFGYTLAGTCWAALVFAVAAAVPMRDALRARLPLHLRIGVRDRQLVVTDTERGMREFPLPQVAWDETQLQPAADLTIPLVRDGIELFHAPTLEVVLMPKLNLVKKIGG